MTRVDFTVAAEIDFAEIVAFIAARNPSRARSFADELQAACRGRSRFPHSGRRRRDLRDDLFTFPYGRYLIVYSVEPERVLIRRILHGARDLERALRDEA